MPDDVASDVGRLFDIDLREPATAGYTWSIASLPSSITLVKERRRTARVRQPGNALSHTFQLKASRPGQYQISFRLKRPWEQKSVEVKTMKVRVRA